MIKSEGKLTVITDLGEGLSKEVDGVSLETVRKLEERINTLEDSNKEMALTLRQYEELLNALG